MNRREHPPLWYLIFVGLSPVGGIIFAVLGYLSLGQGDLFRGVVYIGGGIWIVVASVYQFVRILRRRIS